MSDFEEEKLRTCTSLFNSNFLRVTNIWYVKIRNKMKRKKKDAGLLSVLIRKETSDNWAFETRWKIQKIEMARKTLLRSTVDCLSVLWKEKFILVVSDQYTYKKVQLNNEVHCVVKLLRTAFYSPINRKIFYSYTVYIYIINFNNHNICYISNTSVLKNLTCQKVT